MKRLRDMTTQNHTPIHKETTPLKTTPFLLMIVPALLLAAASAPTQPPEPQAPSSPPGLSQTPRTGPNRESGRKDKTGSQQDKPAAAGAARSAEKPGKNPAAVEPGRNISQREIVPPPAQQPRNMKPSRMATPIIKQTPSVSDQPAAADQRTPRLRDRINSTAKNAPETNGNAQPAANEKPSRKPNQPLITTNDRSKSPVDKPVESPQPALRERLLNRTNKQPIQDRRADQPDSQLAPANIEKRKTPESDSIRRNTPATSFKPPSGEQPKTSDASKTANETGSVDNLRNLLNQRRNPATGKTAAKPSDAALETKPGKQGTVTPALPNGTTGILPALSGTRPADTRAPQDILRNRKTQSTTGQPKIPAPPLTGSPKTAPNTPGSILDSARMPRQPSGLNDTRAAKEPAYAKQDAIIQHFRDLKLPGMDRPLPSADELSKISSKIPPQRLENFALRQRAKAALVGADIKPEIFKDLGLNEKLLSKKDARNLIGNAELKHRPALSKTDLANFRIGRLPGHIERPFGDYGRVTRAADLSMALKFMAPPPPPRHGYGIDIAGLSWNYWDGRSYYDHAYAMNIFMNIGKTRYDGYDGIMWGGRYYCYGWGWVDGCIDYGDCRVWVPGFWAPYTVSECSPGQVWIPPVYEWIWTDSCWEYIQVDGGYFDYVGSSNCRPVTRWAWVPGHYEYYNC
ncbi:MAG: hypothetical protein WCK47_10485 [bacterium]|nr:hypothetical protein [Candidatus Sumerlaeota bacterium]